MKTTTMSQRDTLQFAHGRVSARPELDPLAELLSAYRSAAIGAAPRPSAALSARLDLSATPIAMQRDAVSDGESNGAGARRAASGLLGLGVTVAIILGAASGAAAVVGAGSAGVLPPGAQDAFDQVVSVIAPPGVAGQGTTGQGGAPGDSTDSTTPRETADQNAPSHGGASGDATSGGASGGDNANLGNGNGAVGPSTSDGSSDTNSGNSTSGSGDGSDKAADKASDTADKDAEKAAKAVEKDSDKSDKGK